MQNPQDVQLAANRLQSLLPENCRNPQTGIVLGTGLSSLADRLGAGAPSIPFSEIPGFPVSGVQSHAGAFCAVCAGNMPVLIQLGRVHLYEGFSPADVCMGVRVMGLLGCKTLIITNAAGALNPFFEAPGLMCICDIINHTGVSPLTGANCELWGERFPDMSAPFDSGLISLAAKTALANGIRLENGVYIGVHGPEMETPAETRMYRQWGADAIGMSTALEVIAARHMGMRCLGISCLTNKNLPDCMSPAPLAQVIAAARAAGASLSSLLADILAALAGENDA